MTDRTQDNLSRRKLLVRSAKAGASIAAAAALSCFTLDRDGPSPETGRQDLVTVPDFSVGRRSNQAISIVKGRDRSKNLSKAIELLGGIERFVEPGETVLIKPNVAFASSPRLGATTHPQLIVELTGLCLEKAGARQVLITDNPINDPASCFELTGIAKAAASAGAEIVLPRENFFQNTTLAGGKLIKNWPILYGPLEKADKLIGVAPVKDHHRSGASMAMKNWYGLLGGRRNIFHQDINTIIAELATMIKPTLVILDGAEVMLTNGPTGGSTADLARKDTLIASTDQVAADSFAAALLGLKTSDLGYLRKAEAAGAGTTDYESLNPKFATIT